MVTNKILIKAILSIFLIIIVSMILNHYFETKKRTEENLEQKALDRILNGVRNE